jgi:hypothetical protein
VLGSLWRLQQESDNDGGTRPHVVRMDSSGRETWAWFTNQLAQQMNQESFPNCLRGPWSKHRGYGARLALILHNLRMATGEIDAEDVDNVSMERAAVLIRYFQSHARKVYATLEADKETQAALRILKWIAREERTTFKTWEVHKDIYNQCQFPKIEDLEHPLERLVKHNYIRALPSPERQGRGRPPDPGFEVNPLWDHRKNLVNATG